LLSREAEVNSIIADLSRKLMELRSLDEMALLVLENAKQLTESPLGYIGYVDCKTGTLLSPVIAQEDIDLDGGDDLRKTFEDLALWSQRHGETLLANGFEDPELLGISSDGYFPLDRIISVPAITSGKVLGQIVLANSKRDYTEQDAARLQNIANMYALATQHLQAAINLRQANDYLENIIENSPDAIGIVDERGKFIKWNKRAAELHGYEFEDLKELRAFDLYADQGELDSIMAQLKTNGAVRKYEVKLKKKDGYTCVSEIAISLMKDGANRILGSVCVARDLSPLKKAFEQLQKEVAERQRMEYELRESERRFRDTLENIHLLAVSLDKQGQITFCNGFFKQFVGLNVEEILGRNWFETFLPDEQRESFRLIFTNAMGEGEIPSHFEREIVTHHGERKLISWNNTILFDLGGKVIGATCIGQDISEARKAEEELRRTHTEMAQLLASIPSFLIGLSPDRRIIKWNSSAERIFGIAGDGMLGVSIDDCPINWDRQKVSEAISLCQASNAATRLDSFRFVHPDGKHGFLSINISSIVGKSHGSSGMLLLGSDTTKQKILEGQLVQAQKLESIGQLAAGIAHEINTPAQYVGDNTRFLQQAFDDLEDVHKHYNGLLEAVRDGGATEDHIRAVEIAAGKADLEYIKEEIPKAIRQSLDGVDRISRIVRAMKEFSHPGTDEKTNIDLNKAIESTITVAGNEWKYVADVVTEFDPKLPFVPCLPGAFNQVILNLIINATHAITEKAVNGPDGKGTITVSTHAQGKFAEIRIHDTGAGIREDIRSRIFDPFFTTKDVGKGTGQGLAIARSVIVDKHGGSIDFETAVGQGTTFIIKVPLSTVGLETK
ncbi:MAG: PAS domain S-box protein, partial [Syntrophobacteraceae bacterium]